MLITNNLKKYCRDKIEVIYTYCMVFVEVYLLQNEFKGCYICANVYKKCYLKTRLSEVSSDRDCFIEKHQ